MIGLGYFISSISFIIGLKFMSSPKQASKGNILAVFGMVTAIIVTLVLVKSATLPLTNMLVIGGTLLLGLIVGKRLSDKVEMTGMPQLISLFNASGGACAMLLGIVEGRNLTMGATDSISISLLLSGMIIGAIAFTGSVLAYGKLSGKTKDKRSKALVYTTRVVLLVIVVMPALYVYGLVAMAPLPFIILMAALAMIYGALFVLPIGGADMPVVISLLNALTGIATAFTGLVYSNKAMIAGGILVGAAGILLTLLMCKAMNRSLFQVLKGSFKNGLAAMEEGEQAIIQTSVAETALQLSMAQRVAIIPGYGLAVAQAQHLCAQLLQKLEDRGTEVHFIIHPVAGRMPGHMNVLLAEAKIDYSQLREMDEVNDHLGDYDMALVVGANDVVNPAAERDENSPVYGMPIIRAYKAKQAVVLKRGMSKGYAGVRNELFDRPNCRLLFGDAKESLQEIVNQLKLI